MKRTSVFLAECTWVEVEDQLKRCDRIFVPIGSTEQHGPHGPQGTDTILATEVCVRLAHRIGGLVAPPIWYGYSLDHLGFPGLTWLTAATLSAVVHDVALSLSVGGFREIIFVNGHYTNVVALNAAVGAVADELAKGSVAFSFTYWDGLPPDELEEFLSLGTGLHSQIGETSAMLAVDESLVDMEKAVAEWPDFPVQELSPILSYCFSSPGTIFRATRSGVWGDPRGATAEKGARYLDQVEESCVRLIASIEKTFDALPARPHSETE